MLTWDNIGKWGRRASDMGATPPPVAPQRDLLLEAAIAHEQIDVLFQPLIEPPGQDAVLQVAVLFRLHRNSPPTQ